MFSEIDGLVRAFERRAITRRELVTRMGAVVAAAGVAGRAAGQVAEPKSGHTFEAVGLNHVALAVGDVPRSRDFYVRHLGLKVTSDSERRCFLDCGPHFVALFRSQQPGLDHYCYSIEGYDAADAVRRIEAAGLKPRRTENRVYFDDPDGITVQVASA